MDYEEQFDEWFEKYGEEDLKFETLDESRKFHPAKQVSAIMFLASKLKEVEDKDIYKGKDVRFFLHGEHDVIYIGSDMDIFEEFTEEDVKTAVAHGISISDDGDGFQMYASM